MQSIEQFTVITQTDELDHLIYRESRKNLSWWIILKNAYTISVKRYYANVDVPENRCHVIVRLFTKFMTLRPKTSKEFYLLPKKSVKLGEEEWYYDRSIGHNTANHVVQDVRKSRIEGA